MPRAQQPLDGTVSEWLIPFMLAVKVDPAPTVQEAQRWLDQFYPELEARGHAEAEHHPVQARRRVGWANVKAAAVARWRFYLTRSPRSLRDAPDEEAAVLLEIQERLERFDPRAEHSSLDEMGIKRFVH